MTSAKSLLILRDFAPEYHHAKTGGNWTTNKVKTEGAQCAPPAYILPKYPSLNRVNGHNQFHNRLVYDIKGYKRI